MSNRKIAVYNVLFLTSNLCPVLSGVYVYHLRCYIYQARNLMALDKDSFSGKGEKDSISHVITQQASSILLFIKWML